MKSQGILKRILSGNPDFRSLSVNNMYTIKFFMPPLFVECGRALSVAHVRLSVRACVRASVRPSVRPSFR